jgi:hypothetical protein
MQPLALVTLFVLAIAGRGGEQAGGMEPEKSRVVERLRAVRHMRPPTIAVRGMAAVCALTVGYLGAAYVSSNAPFAPSPYFSRHVIVDALPADFPVPPAARVRDTGPGETWPYRIEWETNMPVSQVAGIMTRRLDAGAWSTSRTTETDSAITVRSARDVAGTDGDVVADVTVLADGAGTKVTIEFAPLPATSIAGYERWLEDRGIIVKNVAPEDYEGLRTR